MRVEQMTNIGRDLVKLVDSAEDFAYRLHSDCERGSFNPRYGELLVVVRAHVLRFGDRLRLPIVVYGDGLANPHVANARCRIPLDEVNLQSEPAYAEVGEVLLFLQRRGIRNLIIIAARGFYQIAHFM